MTAENAAAAGTLREATDLVREALGRLREAWQQFVGSVQGLVSRARLFLRDDHVWSAVVRGLETDIAEAIAAIETQLGRIRPGVDRILELMRPVADRTAPIRARMEAAVEAALAHGGDVAGRLSAMATEMRVRGSEAVEMSVRGGDAAETAARGADDRGFRRGFAKRVADQIGAADAAVRAAAVSRWLSAGTTAYAVDLGHLGAELTGRFVSAATDADEITAGGLPAYAGDLRVLADRVESSVRRAGDWTAELQRLFGEARVADLR
jgi:hypothetical protein